METDNNILRAERRIKHCISAGSLTLDLSGLDLTTLPDSIGKAAHIKSLRLRKNRLTELPASMSQLTQLRILDLSNNRLRELPHWLFNFRELMYFDVSDLECVSIPEEIGRLSNLKTLGIIGCKNLRSLPDALGNLTSLTSLSAFFNALEELPSSIDRLKSLETLDVSNNKLRSIPRAILSLKNLRRLDLEGNQLTRLPAWLRSLNNLEELYLQENELLGLPSEILGPSWIDTDKLKRPSPPKVILDYYFRSRRGNRPLNEAKLILVGRGSVGKTSIIKRLISDTFNAREKETPGIEIKPWSIKTADGSRVRLHVWDFGGQEILHATHQFFLTERTLYLLVLSGREGHQMEDAEYWLQLIRSFGGNSRVIIVLNKCAQHPFDVNRGLLHEKYPTVTCFHSTDCKKRTGLASLKKAIAREVGAMEHRKKTFPSEWFAIKESLAAMTASFVSWEEYQRICMQFGERDPSAQKILAGHLHDLGIALNYSGDPRLHDTRVLKPRWVTEGIYAVLRSRSLIEKQGVLEPVDLCASLSPADYPREKHDFLIRLMEKFQLCFRLPSKHERYLVPEMLGESQPDLKGILDGPSLRFRYQYEVLPEGLLPRFIVQTHSLSELHPQLRWRSGVVLEYDDCLAVVRADFRDRRVDIHITGPEARRRGLLAVIRSEFDEQHRDLKGLKMDERVPVPHHPNITVGYQDLLKREERGEKSFFPENVDQPIKVQELLNGLESPRARARKRLAEKKPSTDIYASIKGAIRKHPHVEPRIKCRLLFLAANPIGTTQLALDVESREIDSKIRASEYRDTIEHITKWATRPDDLLQNLNQYRPHIVHFSGHGCPTEELILLDDNRLPKPVSKEALRQVFTTLKDNIQVVVLNACYSKAQAAAIAEVIDCTIGMKQAIGDEAAITFVAAFYRAIGFGRSLQDAFDQGKAALMLANIPEENTPELIMRKGVSAKSLVLVKG